MVSGGERRRKSHGSIYQGHSNRRRDQEGAGRRLEPARLGLGVGQCRLGQDPCARPPRHPPAPCRRRSRPHPLPHLHPRRRRRDGEAGLRHPRRMDGAVRHEARRRHPGDRAAPPGQGDAGASAAALRPCAGNPGWPQDPDHPRLLRAAPPPVSVRGQCRGAFRGARPARRRGAVRSGPPQHDGPRRR